jgi:pimeloyl-ACP methyl ester carboxylesterase
MGMGSSPGLAVLGHSWGGMVAAALPATGLVPKTLILLDPPALSLDGLLALTRDPEEKPIEPHEVDAAAAALHAAHPEWHRGDARAKAEGRTRYDREAVRAVLLDNGDWDAGLADLAHPAAGDADVWLIRGEWAMGGLIPDAALPALHEQLGVDHVVTLAGVGHSPQRTHIEATVAAILRALGG